VLPFSLNSHQTEEGITSASIHTFSFLFPGISANFSRGEVRGGGIIGMSDETVLNNVLKKNLPLKKVKINNTENKKENSKIKIKIYSP
jgi:hypothetical protein